MFFLVSFFSENVQSYDFCHYLQTSGAHKVFQAKEQDIGDIHKRCGKVMMQRHTCIQWIPVNATAFRPRESEFKPLRRRRQRERHKTIGFNEQNKALHVPCVINFGTFLRRPWQNNNVKLLNLKF